MEVSGEVIYYKLPLKPPEQIQSMGDVLQCDGYSYSPKYTEPSKLPVIVYPGQSLVIADVFSGLSNQQGAGEHVEKSSDCCVLIALQICIV